MMKRAYLGESNLVNLCILSGLCWRRGPLPQHTIPFLFYIWRWSNSRTATWSRKENKWTCGVHMLCLWSFSLLL